VRSSPLARDLLLLLDVHPIVASLAGFLFPFPLDVVRECTLVQCRYGTEITVERQLLTHGAELELDGLEAISELLAALLVVWRQRRHVEEVLGSNRRLGGVGEGRRGRIWRWRWRARGRNVGCRRVRTWHWDTR
jgi:hypothetical protein